MDQPCVRWVVLPRRGRQDELDVPPRQGGVGLADQRRHPGHGRCCRPRPASLLGVAVVGLRRCDSLAPVPGNVAGWPAYPQVVAALRVAGPHALVVHRADSGDAVVVGELAQVGVVTQLRPVAGGEDVQDPVAAEARGDARLDGRFPQCAGKMQAGTVRKTPAVEGHGRRGHLSSDGVRHVGKRGVQRQVVPVDLGLGRYAAHPECVPPCRDDPRHLRPVGMRRGEHGVVAGVNRDSWSRPRCPSDRRGRRVHPVVHDRDVDLGAEVAAGPYLGHVDVLARGSASVPARVVQVPLAPVQRVRDAGRTAQCRRR